MKIAQPLFFIMLFLLAALCTHAQTSTQLVDVNKIYIKKDVVLTDGLVYKWTVVSDNDTARYFIPGIDKYEATVVFKKVGGTTPPVDIIDSVTVDSEEGVIFSSGWTGHGTTSAPGWYKATIAYSTLAGTTASYTFTGRQVKIYAERILSHGTGTVSILKGTQVIVNEAPVSFKNSVKQLPVLVYSSPVLADDTYTVVLKAKGDGPILLDYFRYFKKR